MALVDADELDEGDRAALEAALAEGEADVGAGRIHSEADLWSRLKALG